MSLYRKRWSRTSPLGSGKLVCLCVDDKNLCVFKDWVSKIASDNDLYCEINKVSLLEYALKRGIPFLTGV